MKYIKVFEAVTEISWEDFENEKKFGRELTKREIEVLSKTVNVNKWCKTSIKGSGRFDYVVFYDDGYYYFDGLYRKKCDNLSELSDEIIINHILYQGESKYKSFVYDEEWLINKIDEGKEVIINNIGVSKFLSRGFYKSLYYLLNKTKDISFETAKYTITKIIDPKENDSENENKKEYLEKILVNLISRFPNEKLNFSQGSFLYWSIDAGYKKVVNELVKRKEFNLTLKKGAVIKYAIANNDDELFNKLVDKINFDDAYSDADAWKASASNAYIEGTIYSFVIPKLQPIYSFVYNKTNDRMFSEVLKRTTLNSYIMRIIAGMRTPSYLRILLKDKRSHVFLKKFGGYDQLVKYDLYVMCKTLPEILSKNIHILKLLSVGELADIYGDRFMDHILKFSEFNEK